MAAASRWGRVALAGMTGWWLLAGGIACSGNPEAKTAAAAQTAAAAEPAPPLAADARTRRDAPPSADAVAAAVTVLPQVDEVPPEEDPTEGAEGQLADALEAYESSEVFWQQGGFDDAFAALDRAYELMAAVPMNGDPAVNQEKDNLRRLISHRLVEIYASLQTTVGDLDRSIPLTVNDDVRAEIARFQGPERQFFLDSYSRSGLYRPMMLEALRKAGLPEQLSWLPLVESGFKARAFSSARALGLWQFISSTGYRYDLRRTPWVDQRMDPEAATAAAIGYLTDLHGLFGDWLTALAAYNCGENAVFRVIQRQPVAYFDRFWDLYQQLPRETRRYVPRFLAVLAILDDPAAYGFDDLPEPLPAVPVERYTVERALKLEALNDALSLPKGTLEGLNPELRLSATPPDPYALRVPAGTAASLAERIAALPEWAPAAQAITTHRVRRGDTLEPGGGTLRHQRRPDHAAQPPAQRPPHLPRPAAAGARPARRRRRGGERTGARGAAAGAARRQPVEHRPALRHHHRPHPPRQRPRGATCCSRARSWCCTPAATERRLHRAPRRHPGLDRPPPRRVARQAPAREPPVDAQHHLPGPDAAHPGLSGRMRAAP